jgi:hypothetical protein
MIARATHGSPPFGRPAGDCDQLLPQTIERLCVAVTGLVRKNAAKNALGVDELPALPQGERLFDRG